MNLKWVDFVKSEQFREREIEASQDRLLKFLFWTLLKYRFLKLLVLPKENYYYI